MNNVIDYKLYIRCFAYNHAPYIEDAMNGFCMQQTTFPYVAVIIDDAYRWGVGGHSAVPSGTFRF